MDIESVSIVERGKIMVKKLYKCKVCDREELVNCSMDDTHHIVCCDKYMRRIFNVNVNTAFDGSYKKENNK